MEDMNGPKGFNSTNQNYKDSLPIPQSRMHQEIG